LRKQDGGWSNFHAPTKSWDFAKSHSAVLLIETFLILYRSCQSIVYRSLIALSRCPLLKLFKLCPWGQKWLSHGGHNFTLNYILQCCKENLKLLLLLNGNLNKFNRNGPWVVFYQSCLIGCISRSRVKKRFSKCNFQISCLKLYGPEISYLAYN